MKTEKLYQNKEWLKEKYKKDELSTSQINKLCGMTGVIYWLKKYNIIRRSNGESQHLSRTKHCKLSSEAIEWLNGELLGDGYINKRNPYSARFKYTSKYKEYIQYVSDILNSYGIEQIGRIDKEYYDKKTNFLNFRYCSSSYPELLPIHKRWYSNGKKIVPKDIKLTSLTVRQWFIGDGYLRHSKDSRSHIRLGTYGFLPEDVKWLVKQLINLGIEATKWLSDNTINISVNSTKDFLDYIGKCPVNCYQYKWEY